MKRKITGVATNVLACVLAIAFFGVFLAEGTIQKAKGISVGSATDEKVLQADGNGPPPPPLSALRNMSA